MIAYQRNLYMEYLNEEQRHVQIVHSSLEEILTASIKNTNKVKRNIIELIKEAEKGNDITNRLEAYRIELR